MTEANLTDVATLRSRARQNVENGAVTEGYDADREEIIRLLNASLATELVCVLRYKRHYFMASGVKAQIAAEEFLEHATQEAEHADKATLPPFFVMAASRLEFAAVYAPVQFTSAVNSTYDTPAGITILSVVES